MFTVCDVAPVRVDLNGDGDHDDADEFGDAAIANLDIVALFRASLLPSERPVPHSERATAMDAAPEDTPPTCGGDHRILNSDVVLCFRRSLLAALPSYEREIDANECHSRNVPVTGP